MVCRCPDRYLFDPVSRLCQRASKVTCDPALAPDLFYSAVGRLVVRLQEQDLDTFFQQQLTLDQGPESRGQGGQDGPVNTVSPLQNVVQGHYLPWYPLHPLHPLQPLHPLHPLQPLYQVAPGLTFRHYY